MSVTMVIGEQVKRFKSLNEMTMALNAPASSVELVKATRCSYFVFVRGQLVGEATKVRV